MWTPRSGRDRHVFDGDQITSVHPRACKNNGHTAITVRLLNCKKATKEESSSTVPRMGVRAVVWPVFGAGTASHAPKHFYPVLNTEDDDRLQVMRARRGTTSEGGWAFPSAAPGGFPIFRLLFVWARTPLQCRKVAEVVF